MTGEGDIVITANTYRTQEQNRKDAKIRRPSKPGKNAKVKRIDTTKQRGATKKGRGRISNIDY